MKPYHLIPTTIILIAASCSQPTTEISPTHSPTLVPSPTWTLVLTPTLIPLSDIDLESILVVDGDLPATISPGQIRDFPPVEIELLGETKTSALYKFVDTMPDPDSSSYQELYSSEIRFEGGVTIFLYKSSEDAEVTYQEIVTYVQKNEPYSFDTDNSSPVSDVGEEAVVIDMGFNLDFVHTAAFSFRRCHAVIHILLRGGDTDQVTGYAKRLDERIESLVCR